ncbi:MAG: HEAT repeat domain-containing protein, partial [Gemmatimonadaceae bacterium]|nr:HEAT repeat domain-containing protein [Gemmatimonadaceae bacterium]
VAALKRSLTDKSCAGYRSIAALADPEMNAFYALTPKGWTQVWPVPDWCVRFVAVHALGQIGGHEALDALVTLSRDSEERVRRASCMALSRFHDPASVEALAARITDNAGVQFLAVAALGKIGTDAARNALPQFVTGGADEVTKAAAKAALERLRPPAKSIRPANPTR